MMMTTTKEKRATGTGQTNNQKDLVVGALTRQENGLPETAGMRSVSSATMVK